MEAQENLNQYEALKHDPIIPEDLRVRWIKADQAANWMTYDWNKIIGDEDLTPEAKVRRAQEVYDARAQGRRRASAVKARCAEGRTERRESFYPEAQGTQH